MDNGPEASQLAANEQIAFRDTQILLLIHTRQNLQLQQIHQLKRSEQSHLFSLSR